MKLLDFCKAFSDACEVIQKWVGKEIDDPWFEEGDPIVYIGDIEIGLTYLEDEPDNYYEYFSYMRIYDERFKFNVLNIYPITITYEYSGKYKGNNLISILILADMITNGVLLKSLDEYAKYRMNNK